MATPAWAIPGTVDEEDIVGVWQARDAADFAASLVNLADPGTNDLTTDTHAPGWNAGEGWVGDGTQYLIGPLVQHPFTVIVKFSGYELTMTNDIDARSAGLFGCPGASYYLDSYSGAGKPKTNSKPYPSYDGQNISNGPVPSKVFAGIAAVKPDCAFFGATKIPYAQPAVLAVGDRRMYLMAGGDGYLPAKCHFEAAVIYNRQLTDDEYYAVREAMATAMPHASRVMYASPSGTDNGDGSLGNPYSAKKVFSGSVTGAGDTVYLMPGTYIGPFDAYASGDMGNRLVFKPQEVGGRPVGVVRIKDQFRSYGVSVDFRDMEFFYDWPTGRYDETGGSNPPISEHRVLVYGEDTHWINCIMHDTAEVGGNMSGGGEFYGCVMYYQGWAAVDRGHGHSLYVQNKSDDDPIIKRNIWFSQFGGFGLHLFGHGDYGDRFQVYENIGFNSYRAMDAQANSPYYSFYLGTLGVSDGVAFVRNMLYDLGLELYCPGQATNLLVKDNDMGRSCSLFNENTTFDPTSNQTSSTYYANWPQTFSPVIPGTNVIRVYPNEYKDGAGIAAIYNWQLLDTVQLDLSAITTLSAGDVISLWDVQAGVGAGRVSYVVPANKIIAVDMRASQHTQSAPIGWPAGSPQPNSFPEFGAFVIETTAEQLPPAITQGSAVAVTMSKDGVPDAFSLALSATDESPSTLTWDVSAPAAHGTAQVSGAGATASVSYIPAGGFTGTDTFTVRVTDAYGLWALTVVTVTVEAPPALPPGTSLVETGTFSSLLLAIARKLDDHVGEGAATGGTTTRMADARMTEPDGFFSGGTIFFLSGANAGLSRVVNEHAAAACTFALLPYAVAPGDRYALVPPRYNRFELAAAANAALFEAGPIMRLATITATGASEYALPAGVWGVRRVEHYATGATPARNLHWMESGGTLYFDTGYEPESGDTIRIWHVARHALLERDDELVSLDIYWQKAIWGGVYYALYTRSQNNAATTPDMKQALDRARLMWDEMKMRYPNRTMPVDPHLSWWGK